MVCGENQACSVRPAKVRQLDKYTQENYGGKKEAILKTHGDDLPPWTALIHWVMPINIQTLSSTPKVTLFRKMKSCERLRARLVGVFKN